MIHQLKGRPFEYLEINKPFLVSVYGRGWAMVKENKAKTFSEPNSDRFIASILDQSIEFATAIRYEVHSLNDCNFLTGVFLIGGMVKQKCRTIHSDQT